MVICKLTDQVVEGLTTNWWRFPRYVFKSNPSFWIEWVVIIKSDDRNRKKKNRMVPWPSFLLTHKKNSFLILDTIRVSDIERCFVSSLRDKSSKDHGLDKEQDLDFRQVETFRIIVVEVILQPTLWRASFPATLATVMKHQECHMCWHCQ